MLMQYTGFNEENFSTCVEEFMGEYHINNYISYIFTLCSHCCICGINSVVLNISCIFFIQIYSKFYVNVSYLIFVYMVTNIT